MADLAITVDMSSVTQAEKKVNSFQNQLNRLIKKQREGAISDEAFAKGKLEIKRAYQEVGVSSQKASGQVEKYVRQMNEAKKAQDRAADMQKWFTNQRRKMRMMEESARLEQQQIRSQERLREKYVPLYAASKRYERALEEINQAHRDGVFSTQQYNNAIEQLNADFARTRQVGVGNTRSMNNFGVAMQQSGYQVGDFLVQVQSGTNAFVAFGQQATQLVGILPMFADQIKFLSSTALIGLSAGLGIVIPLVTALAGAFMRTRQEAEDASKEFDGLSTAINDLEGYSVDLVESNEKIRDSFQGIIDVVREVKAEALEARLDEIIEPYEEQIRSFENRMSNFLRFGGRRGGPLEPDFEGLGFENVMQAAQAVDLLRRVQGDTKEEIAESVRLVEQQLRGSGLLTDEVKQLLVQYSDAVGLQEIAVEETEKQASSLQKVVGLSQTAKNETKDYISDMAGVFEKAKDLREELGDAAYNALRLSGVDISNPISDANKEAAKLAANLNIALVDALSLQNMREGMVYSGRGEARGRPATESVRVPPGQTRGEGITPFDLTLENMLPPSLPNSDRGTGGGGGSGETLQERINKAREAVDKLRASYDEQYATSLKVADAEETVNKALELGVVDKTEADRILQQYTQSLRETDSVMGDFANDAAKQMSDAFMSIVDGSKSASDAFQNMAQAIIRQAFEMAVINPIMNSIFGGVSGFNPLPAFFADGAAFNKGKVTPFADGGVVNQPTVFPMANGAGLMGEAGPEAVIPLKRGKDGKLGVQAQGNSQPVVINQTFQFSANGDDSVKRIITQEAPKIANLTKRQILEERSRGGAFKKTFG